MKLKEDRTQLAQNESNLIAFIKRGVPFPAFIATVVAALMIILGAFYFGFTKSFSSETTSHIIGFEDVGDLTTQSAYCTEVKTLTSSRNILGIQIPFTQSQCIYSYDVIVNAGYDFSQIQCVPKESVSQIVIYLPEVKITGTELVEDSFKLYIEDQSIFSPITLEDNNNAIQELQEEAKQKAIDNGLYEAARANVENLLKGFLSSQFDLNVSDVVFKDF